MIPLTQEEKRVVIFLLGLLLIGMGLDFAIKKIGPFHLIDENTIRQKVFRKVNINKATLHELQSVPGIGKKLSREIYDYRKAEGEFLNLEQLKEVKGIKNKKLKEIKPYICLGSHQK